MTTNIYERGRARRALRERLEAEHPGGSCWIIGVQPGGMGVDPAGELTGESSGPVRVGPAVEVTPAMAAAYVVDHGWDLARPDEITDAKQQAEQRREGVFLDTVDRIRRGPSTGAIHVEPRSKDNRAAATRRR